MQEQPASREDAVLNRNYRLHTSIYSGIEHVRTLSPSVGEKLNRTRTQGQTATNELPIVIAVMGMTGAGKSTFIHKVTGLDTGIGHDMASKTKEVKIYKTERHGREVWFLDTPGFDDTRASDAETLGMITKELADQHRAGLKVNGVIYLHSILENRMKGTANKNIHMLLQMVGLDNLKNVTVASTMWDALRDKAEGERREADLKKNYWNQFENWLATITRVEDPNNLASYTDIVDDLMKKNGVTLQITHEVVDEGKTLEETSAGREILSEVEKATKELKDQIADLNKELSEAKTNASAEMAKLIKLMEDEKIERMEELRQAASDRAILLMTAEELRKDLAVRGGDNQMPGPCPSQEDRIAEYERLVNLAADFFERGRMESALYYFTQALTLATNVFGPNDWRTLECKYNVDTIDSCWIGTNADTGYTGR
ncbi:hypothetical protein HFD88_002571 [Aspergillus terreus]|nr:hypothetical protein HFD88_002571 [Aspergillus terreus]